MRKIITKTFLTLDGVMQAPGGPTEDTSGGFAYGGWQTSFPQDEKLNSILGGFFGIPFELLLGRITYDILPGIGPTQKQTSRWRSPFNKTKKYVVSHKSFEPSWHNSFCITGDVVAQIKKLKRRGWTGLMGMGQWDLIQTLLKTI